MTVGETQRIARLLVQAFDGDAYFGPSVLGALKNVTAATATRKPDGAAHSIWELVHHLTAELQYARALLTGTAGPWVAGDTTWHAVGDISDEAWRRALSSLAEENQALVLAVEQLDDAILAEQVAQVHATYYVVLHGTIQHHAYHAGQISLLKRQLAS